MIKLLIQSLVMLSTLMLNATNEELFSSAHKHYQQKEFTEALADYQAIEKKGAAVWYNMGNCSYHLKDYEKAHTYWSLAQKRATGSLLHDAIANSDSIRDQVLSEKYASWSQRIILTLQRFALSWSLFTLQILFLLCWCLICVVLLRPTTRRKIAVLYLIAAITALLGMLMITHYTFRFEKIGIIDKPTVMLFAGPNADYHTLGTLNASDQVRIHELKDSWCKVECEQLIGWIPVDTLVLV